MTQSLKHFSYIKDEYNTIICGVNGVISYGNEINRPAVDALVKMYQSGIKIALASNSSLRINNLFGFLKNKKIPMNIFYAMITAGEIAHFYLKNNQNFGKSYYLVNKEHSEVLEGLNYVKTKNISTADFVLAEAGEKGADTATAMPILEQALELQLPLICVGNNTSIVGQNGVCDSVGVLAEQYAVQGGKIVTFGKPDWRISSYLTESLQNFDKSKCLVIGDNMPIDIRMGNACNYKTMLITGGVHQLYGTDMKKIDELSANYGLNIDYCMENLAW